jgi:LacI family transcriptional regulator
MSKKLALKRPTMMDVARHSGHSRSTVDRVLNGRTTVRSDTASRIHQAAQELGFYAAGVINERMRDVRPRLTLGFLLQLPHAAFYQGLAAALTKATQECPAMRGRVVIEFLKDQSPENVAAQLLSLGDKVDAIAVVAADHALISNAIETLHQKQVRVFALISDLSSPLRAGYAGLDNRRLGRTAAWLITELTREPGPIAIFVGTHRFQCQELSEISLRSYMREYAPDFELLETISTLESDAYGEERTHELLDAHPDLAGFYMGGSGIEGVLKALEKRKKKNRDSSRIVGVGTELTPLTRAGMINRHFHAVLSHPLPLLCRELVLHMAQAVAAPSEGIQQVLVPLEIHLPESV